MDAKLSVLDNATRARLLLQELDSEDIAALLASALRMFEAAEHLRGRAHQMALPILEREWRWEPLVIGAEPRIIGEE